MTNIPTLTPTHNVQLSSYADKITITATHHQHETATVQAQQYIYTMEEWLNSNGLKVAMIKSTIILLTNDKKEHKITLHITLNNTPIPHTHSTKVLGVAYNTSMSFAPHIANITKKCNFRLNTLRLSQGQISGKTRGPIYSYTNNTSDQYWIMQVQHGPLASHKHNTLQTTQNRALKIITGCTQTTPTEHIHAETKSSDSANILT
jgi:hypothetical protein